MIKTIPVFVTSDGVEHRDIDSAAKHEQYLMIQHRLLLKKDELGLPLTTIDRIARVIQDTQAEMTDIFKIDLKRGFHSGGIVRNAGLRSGEVPAFLPRGEAILPSDAEIKLRKAADSARDAADREKERQRLRGESTLAEALEAELAKSAVG